MQDAPGSELLLALDKDGEVRRQAWSVLVSRHSPSMYAVARSFSLDAGTAEDLVQTAWLRLLERRDDLRDADALGAWLCMVVRNEARRVVTRRREIPSVLGLEGQAAEGTVEDALLRGEREQSLRRAFARLGPDCQRLLRLLLAEPPLSYDEIAVAVDRPRGSLGPTRRRCLDSLRRYLPDDLL